MVGFADFSDTDNESAIDEIISQARDASVLDQLSAINCASFTDSVLPTDLESRFRKLKSFPITKSKQIPKTSDYSAKGKAGSGSFPNEQAPQFSPSKEEAKIRSKSMSDYPDVSKDEDSCRKEEVKAKSEQESKHGPVSSPSHSSNSSEESSMSSLFKQEMYGNKVSNHRSRGHSSNLRMDSSPSPPRKAGCFWCSPKKKKSKENWDSANILGWDKNDEFLSDISSFSSKHQQKILKKAIKEEQKINREAEKIVQWAKQTSARMNSPAFDDDLSD